MDLTSPILFFKADGSGEPGAYTYWTISKKHYQIQPDDVLEYDIFIDSITPMPQVAVDVHLTSGKSMRQFNCSDQNGILARPDANLEKAAAQWYHRKIALNLLAGKTADSWEIAFVGSLKGTYIAAFANIHITRNGQIIAAIYAANEPECSEKHDQHGFDDVFIRGIANAKYRSQKMEFVTPVQLIPEIGTARLLQR
ncbi:hypothetical protein KAH55_11995, partial [bacterium]|nr:hypothetical protein [bacterium]